MPAARADSFRRERRSDFMGHILVARSPAHKCTWWSKVLEHGPAVFPDGADREIAEQSRVNCPRPDSVKCGGGVAGCADRDPQQMSGSNPAFTSAGADHCDDYSSVLAARKPRLLTREPKSDQFRRAERA